MDKLMTILPGTIFLVVGFVLLLWAHKIQQYLLTRSVTGWRRFNPFLPWMRTKAYVWTMRSGGFLLIIIFVFVTFFVIRS